MRESKSKSVFLKIVEAVIWCILGASIAFTAMAELAPINKMIIILAIVLIMIIFFLLFFMGSGNDSAGRVENNRTRIPESVPKARAQENARAGAQLKSEARISRNAGVQSGNPLDQKPMSTQKKEMQRKEKTQAKSLVLINEEGDTLLEWSLAGKTALIIGKSTEKEKVDIDLECSAYAQMISKQHAVLNYTDGGWYIDDIDSKNGTRVKKLYQNSIMDVKLVGTVEVECGDIIYIANTMLQLK